MQEPIKSINDQLKGISDVPPAWLNQAFNHVMMVTNTSFDVIDADFNLVHVNPEWERHYGPVAGRKCHDYFFSRATMCPDCLIPKSLRTRQPQVAEREMRQEHGRVVQVHTVPFQSPTGEWLVAEFNLDITAQRRTIDELRSERNLLQAVMDAAPDQFYVKDAGGRYVLANRSTLAFMGMSDIASLIGRSDKELPCSEEVSERTAADEKVLASGAPLLNSEEIARDLSSGLERAFLVSRVPFQNAQGAVAGMVAIARDITEHKYLENQLREMQRLESLGVLAGGIAHDFNNILQTVLGNADLLALDKSLSAFNQECVESISRAGFRMAELTRQMLAYSGEHQLELRPIAINDVVLEMRSLLEVAVSRKAALVFDLPENLPKIKADPDQIRQVLLNLVTNAVEAVSEPASRITVSTGMLNVNSALLARCALGEGVEPGDYVFLRVEDTGCGMPNDVKAKIFDPFFSTKFIGRGMGLPAVHGIVRGHGGAIHMDSEQDRGSVLTAFFTPIAQEREQPIAGPSAPASSRVVLIVDDEHTVLDVAARMLSKAGFEVLGASTGKEALDIFKEHAHRVGAALLDLSMPDMSGVEIFDALRAINRNLPVLLMSGYAEDEATKRLTGKTYNGFIQKPFNMAMLVTAVRNSVEP